jgi:hypothetical protein
VTPYHSHPSSHFVRRCKVTFLLVSINLRHALRTYTFAQIASIPMVEMRQQIDLSTGKTAVHSYDTCIEKYFLPYFSDCDQPPSYNGTYRRLMRDTGLLKNEEGQNRTLYSLRHTYATVELLAKRDKHT